jgi:hypothetical protein
VIESQLGGLFHEIAQGEPAMSGVDTQLAHRRGRARLRRRRAGLAGTPVLAAAVAVIVALTVGAAPSRPAAGPATGTAAPREFNPLVPYLSFGWLPPGIKLVDGDILRQVVSLDGARKIFDPRDWGLSVYAAGQCHLTAQARNLKCTSAAYGLTSKIDGRAPVVRGHRAFWSGYYLIWPYARGGWALLSAPFPNVPYKGPKRVPSIERQAVKIADNVRYGAATPPLVFPFQLTGLPANWHVSSVFYVPNAGDLQASRWALSASKPDPGADGGLEYQKDLPYFENIGPATSRSSCYVYSARKNFSDKSVVKIIHGYRVVETKLQRGGVRQDLCSAHADGLSIYISQFGAHPPMTPDTLFRDHLRLLGPDPAKWTTKPIG